jgi:hypothetical protein
MHGIYLLDSVALSCIFLHFKHFLARFKRAIGATFIAPEGTALRRGIQRSMLFSELIQG